ncbi:tyrosine-type recombinase/integrase [Streptomyces sp. NPDC088246]|uniref:tyrosine-type recombinase/integrase n=1 Tax=Streptomyces sp. NPDC088246 TaxID=3365842 RepID=UPI00380B5B6A
MESSSVVSWSRSISFSLTWCGSVPRRRQWAARWPTSQPSGQGLPGYPPAGRPGRAASRRAPRLLRTDRRPGRLSSGRFRTHAHQGGEVLDSDYRTDFKSAVKKAGYGDEPWTAHTLRHFFASGAIAGGVSLLEVSRSLGHSTIQITADIYGQLTPDAGGRLRSVMDQVLTGASVVGDGGGAGAGSVLVLRTE